MEYVFLTHMGWVRQTNQDSGVVYPLGEDAILVIVSDGMGGHLAGEVASKMAIDLVSSEIKARWQEEEWDRLLISAIEKANRLIYRQSMEDPGQAGMGTTLEVGLIGKRGGVLAHIGDSRIYFYHPPILQQLTEDHSYAYTLYKHGQITYEEAMNHPKKNMILRALGTEEEIEIDLIPFTWEEGDRLLFCTDGFSNSVNEEVILDGLKDYHHSLEEIGKKLLEKALAAGGQDNITLAIIESSRSSTGGEGS